MRVYIIYTTTVRPHSTVTQPLTLKNYVIYTTTVRPHSTVTQPLTLKNICLHVEQSRCITASVHLLAELCSLLLVSISSTILSEQFLIFFLAKICEQYFTDLRCIIKTFNFVTTVQYLRRMF